MKEQTLPTKSNNHTNGAVSEQHPGPQIRKLRQNKALTLSRLAKMSEVSAGMLSQVERGLANPSIRVLERIRTALGVPLTALLDNTSTQPENIKSIVRRADDRPFFRVGARGLTKHLLSPSGDHDIQFMLIDLPAGCTAHEMLVGPGEKAGLMLEGSATLTVGVETVVLKQGDSFQFESAQPHKLKNHTKVPAQIIWLMNTQAPIAHF